jgi:uncharacterized phage infection (PIP) family protein YhgE
MMNEDRDENVQFRMIPDEEAEENVIPNQVDELRIEKLNQRMTLISILIPVLIVVILGITYLDIKRRVTRTEDVGTETVQHLSENLEDRFSSLSLSQAHLEEALAKLQDQTNQSLARAQVSLKKMDESLAGARKSMVSQKELKSVSLKMDQGLNNVARSADDIRTQVDQLNQSLPSRLGQLDQRMAELDADLSEFQKKLSHLEDRMIDKAALDLALKLEILKIKKSFEAQIDRLQARLRDLEQGSARPSPNASQSSPPSVSDGTPMKATPGSAGPGRLQEQTISK